MKARYWILLTAIIAASAWLILRTGDIAPRVDQKIDLNWRFTMSDDSIFKELNFDDGAWDIVSLPHDWMIHQKAAKANPSSTAGGFFPGGIGWYRKSLDISEFSSKSQFYLQFEGVSMNADVWVNGIHAAHHDYGYMGFHVDISDYLRKDSLNVIAVRTDCSNPPADRWYPGAGIYRHVWLIATESLHFPVFSTQVDQRKKGNERIVTTNTTVVNTERRTKNFKIKTDLLGPDGSLISSTISSRTIRGKGSIDVSVEHQVEEAVLWSDKNPELYEVRSFLLHKKQVTDNAVTRFGIRDAYFSPDSGFILNGKKIWLKGVCIHHDGGALGAAVPDATWEYRLKALKELGVNALRLAHNPHSPVLLDLCDEMGFYVIDEMYDKWELPWDGAASTYTFTESWENDLEYFIKRDRNHPSVVAWSMGNETVEQLEDPVAGVEWYSRLAARARSFDSTRMITCGLHPGYENRNQEIPSSYIYVEPLVSYNYRTDSFASWHQQNPEIIWLASETKAYNESKRDHFEKISYLDNSWLDMEKHIAGQFIWAGIDYLGESAGWPLLGFNNGLLKSNGEIKAHAYYTQSIYLDEPTVKLVVVDKVLVDSLNNSKSWQLPWAGAPVSRHWNWNRNETLEVLVYTNCSEVEITLNDSITRHFQKSDFNDGVIKTSLDYMPGTIKARGYFYAEGGAVLKCRDSLVTAGKPSIILLHPDRQQLIADGADVVHIETHVADSTGITYPTANHMINYRLEGPGNIKVIDNGDPRDQDYSEPGKKRVYNGTHLVLIQSTCEPGDLTISASAEGLKPASLRVKSVPSQQTEQH